MPEPIDFRIGRISDLRLPEGANLALSFTFTGITFSGHTATLTARRGAGGGRVPFTWSKSGLTVGASTIAFNYPQTTTDDNAKALSTVCSTGATDYALTIRESGGAIAMRLQGSIQWVEEVGDYGDGSTGSNSVSVSVDAGTAVTVAVTGTGHEAVTIAASAADVLSVSGQSITADDAGADKLVFWDDSEGKLTHATIGSGLTMTGTTLSAAGSEISDGSITNEKLANMAQATIKGRQAGEGTGAPQDLTASQARATIGAYGEGDNATLGNVTVSTLEVGDAETIDSMTDTWDDSGTTYVGVGIDVTDTASAAESRLFRARLGGAEKWAVRKDGQMVTTGDILVGNGVFVKNAVAQTFFYFDWAGDLLCGQNIQPYGDGVQDLGKTGRRWRRLWINGTVTAGGTTGAQTINKGAGSVNFAAAASSLVVTNSMVSADSIIICTVRTNDATMKSVQAVGGSGTFTLYPNAAPTAETRVDFFVVN